MGKVNIIESGSDVTIYLNGNTGSIGAGGHGQGGDLFLMDKNGSPRIGLNADLGKILLRPPPEAGLPFGPVTIQLDGHTGSISLTGTNGREYVRLSADPKAITLLDSDGNEAIILGTFGNALILGTQGNGGGRLIVRNDAGKDVIVLDGPTGDITLEASDCAEEFDVSSSEEKEPGTVMVLGQEGELRQSDRAYDKKVAGVISGAGLYKPGIVLGRTPSRRGRVPLALAGKAHCKVDADYSSIEVGDLLTTSHTPGHAMKAEDPLQAFGAVIGKALTPLEAGRGLIPILIALQ
jgi:hypothetical protein